MHRSSSSIRAVTFDFWRTLFYAHSKLPERRSARVDTVVRFTGVTREAAKVALKRVSADFLHIHITQQRTLEPADAVPIIEQQLNVSFNSDVRAAIADEIADALLTHPPEPIEGALEAVRRTASLVPVGLISDTGISPGSRIQTLLDRCGFLEHISCLSFSDEVGAAKPQASMFEHAISGLSIEAKSLLHVGDLEPTDVKGAQDFGARAALFAGDNDRYAKASQADFIFNSWADFLDTLPQLLR